MNSKMFAYFILVQSTWVWNKSDFFIQVFHTRSKDRRFMRLAESAKNRTKKKILVLQNSRSSRSKFLLNRTSEICLGIFHLLPDLILGLLSDSPINQFFWSNFAVPLESWWIMTIWKQKVNQNQFLQIQTRFFISFKRHLRIFASMKETKFGFIRALGSDLIFRIRWSVRSWVNLKKGALRLVFRSPITDRDQFKNVSDVRLDHLRVGKNLVK